MFTSRSAVINDALAGGYDFQVGVDHFKKDWRDRVAAKYQQQGAWIPQKVQEAGAVEFRYRFNDDDDAPAVVKAQDAMEWKNHIEAVAAKLRYEFTHGQALYDEGKLTLFEYSALPKENKTVDQFWLMVDGHMVAKSKWTSSMVKILAAELQQEVDARAPVVKRGPQPRRSAIVGAQGIVLVDVDDEGNLVDGPADADVYAQFVGTKAAVVALYHAVAGEAPNPGTVQAVRQQLLAHFNANQLQQVARGAAIRHAGRVTREATLRRKIVEKLADGTILPLQESPAARLKKRSASGDRSAAKSARRR